MIRSEKEFYQYFDMNAIRNVFQRATQIHTKKSFKIHNLWALFEEREGFLPFNQSIDYIFDS